MARYNYTFDVTNLTISADSEDGAYEEIYFLLKQAGISPRSVNVQLEETDDPDLTGESEALTLDERNK